MVWAQSYQVTPAAVRQGEAIRVQASAAATSARLNGRTVPLFPEAAGRLGLMPVPALEPPGAYTLEFLDETGAVVHHTEVTVRDARFRRQNVVLRKEVKELQPSPGEMETVAALRQTVSETRYWSEPFARPLPGCMTSPFGVRRLHNGKPTGSYHGGVDQRGAAGRPVRAAAAGVVRIVRMFNIHGGTVGIDHGQGVTSVYLHLSRFAVEEGARVEKGDIIAYVGSTGRSTAPHLHWSLNVHGIPTNPRQWVALQPCGAPQRKKK
jgi:murein DD-endopeptidase MepM/ murein hydrolase activator NlpD